MSDINAFAEKVLKQFAEQITDKVFLSIENDRDLMREYLKTVDANSLDQVNKTIGKKIKERFNLDNETTKEMKPERENEPESKLILSHQVFK